MSRVEIACFVDEDDAQLAARFLRRHGVRATVPGMYFRWHVNHPYRLLVEQAHAEKATGLFRKVVAGEYADDDPLDNTARGLGAALAEAILPSPGFRRLTMLESYGPLIAIVVLGVVFFLAGVIHELATAGSAP